METLFKAERAIKAISFLHEAQPEKVFEQLCPVRERDWVDGWECEVLFSKSGFAEQSCVFTTISPYDNECEVWFVSSYHKNKSIQFVRTGSHKVTKLEIVLTANQSGTESTWTYEYTSLDETGNQQIREETSEFDEHFKWVGEALNHFLKTGEKLPMKE